MILIATVLFGVLVTALSGASTQSAYDEKTIPVLAIAQRALIDYAAANATRPGRLPCPDTTNTGVADAICGVAGASAIGRLPWKTLGIPDLRDGSGECLWYAVSGTFKENPLTTPINSDSPGQFTIKDDAGNTITTNVIAVVIAPGPPLAAAPIRGNLGTTQCGGNITASAYLDASGAVDNASPAPATFVAGKPTDTFNDRLLIIAPTQLFPPVEKRVAGEIRKALLSYYNTPGANLYFPYANAYTDGTYNCTPGVTRGRVPINIAGSCPGLADWPAPLPTWFTGDQWHLLTYYTLAPACESATPNCTGVGTLTVQTPSTVIPNGKALVIEAGRTLSGQTRPSTSVVDFLDGTENTNGDDIYAMQPTSATFNDTLVFVTP